MIAKGKDASDLFAAVVKNVVSKNIEVSDRICLSMVSDISTTIGEGRPHCITFRTRNGVQ